MDNDVHACILWTVGKPMICLLSHVMTVYLMTNVSLLFNLITFTYELLETLFTKSFDLDVYIIYFTHLDNKRDIGLQYQIESVV